MVTPNIPLKPYSSQDAIHMSDALLRMSIVLFVIVLFGFIGGIVLVRYRE